MADRKEYCLVVHFVTFANNSDNLRMRVAAQSKARSNETKLIDNFTVEVSAKTEVKCERGWFCGLRYLIKLNYKHCKSIRIFECSSQYHSSLILLMHMHSSFPSLYAYSNIKGIPNMHTTTENSTTAVVGASTMHVRIFNNRAVSDSNTWLLPLGLDNTKR